MKNKKIDKKIEVLIPSDDENTPNVIVSCDESQSIKSGNQLLAAVVKAVTKWVQTDSGKLVFAYAGECLNVADLNPNLTIHLKNEGVNNFDVRSIETCGWNYDTPLVDVNSLPEDFEV